MAQAYSDPSREDEDTALPDVKVWADGVFESECCDTPHSASHAGACTGQPCLTCEKPATFRDTGRKAWWFWFCFPGCMPDSEASGPYQSEHEALEAAREQ
jgi:hypothetical protein